MDESMNEKIDEEDDVLSEVTMFHFFTLSKKQTTKLKDCFKEANHNGDGTVCENC